MPKARSTNAVKALVSTNMFLASAKAVQIGHAVDPENKIGCMIQYPTTYPRTCAPKDVLAQRFQMMPNYYYTDVMCRGHYTSLCTAQLRRMGTSVEMQPAMPSCWPQELWITSHSAIIFLQLPVQRKIRIAV